MVRRFSINFFVCSFLLHFFSKEKQLDEILGGGDSDFDTEIEDFRENATQNTDSSATSHKNGHVEPRDNIFDPQPQLQPVLV